jgi:hypothetical protein
MRILKVDTDPNEYSDGTESETWLCLEPVEMTAKVCQFEAGIKPYLFYRTLNLKLPERLDAVVLENFLKSAIAQSLLEAIARDVENVLGIWVWNSNTRNLDEFESLLQEWVVTHG